MPATPDGFSPAIVERDWIRGLNLSENEIRLNLALRLEAAVFTSEARLAHRRSVLTASAIMLVIDILVWLIH
jgi:hypothetical protein